MSLGIMLGNNIWVMEVHQKKMTCPEIHRSAKENEFWKCIRITREYLEIHQIVRLNLEIHQIYRTSDNYRVNETNYGNTSE